MRYTLACRAMGCSSPVTVISLSVRSTPQLTAGEPISKTLSIYGRGPLEKERETIGAGQHELRYLMVFYYTWRRDMSSFPNLRQYTITLALNSSQEAAAIKQSASSAISLLFRLILDELDAWTPTPASSIIPACSKRNNGMGLPGWHGSELDFFHLVLTSSFRRLTALGQLSLGEVPINDSSRFPRIWEVCSTHLSSIW